MGARGVFAIDRGIWDHPMLRSRQPFTRREAWIWLISEATWKARVEFIGGKRMTLVRGQLCHSVRFMAAAWTWPKSNVARFLEALESDAMIGTDTGTGILIITINNYGKFQKVSLPNRDTERDTSGTAAGQQRDRLETKETRKDIKEDDDDGAREPAVLISEQANKLADEIAVIAGHDIAFVPPSWCGAAYRVQAWLNRGWPEGLILDSVKAQAGRKRDGPAMSILYFEPGLASAIAKANQPLPNVVSIPGKTVEITNGTPQAKSPILDAADGYIKTIDVWGAPGAFATGGGTDAAPVRMLPQGGCKRPGDLHCGSYRGPGGLRRGRDLQGDGPANGYPAKAKISAESG